MSRLGALGTITRRARNVGLSGEICVRSSHSTGVTECQRNGGDLEVAARIARHESTRATQPYARVRPLNLEGRQAAFQLLDLMAGREGDETLTRIFRRVEPSKEDVSHSIPSSTAILRIDGLLYGN